MSISQETAPSTSATGGPATVDHNCESPGSAAARAGGVTLFATTLLAVGYWFEILTLVRLKGYRFVPGTMPQIRGFPIYEPWVVVLAIFTATAANAATAFVAARTRNRGNIKRLVRFGTTAAIFLPIMARLTCTMFFGRCTPDFPSHQFLLATLWLPLSLGAIGGVCIATAISQRNCDRSTLQDIDDMSWLLCWTAILSLLVWVVTTQLPGR